MSSQVAHRDGQASVVIVTRDRADVLVDCLRSIESQSTAAAQIIIVAGDSESCPDSLLEQFRHMPVTRKFCPTPNISSARNIGLRAAAHQVVCFIDDDAIAHRDWLRAYLDMFRENPDAVAAGGDVLDARSDPPEYEFARGLIHPSGRQIECRASCASVGSLSGYWMSVKGCNFALNQRVLSAAAMFDEFFRFAFDETDLVVTLQECGGRVIHIPEAVVNHLHSPGLYRAQGDHDRDWATEFASHTMFMLKHTNGTGRFIGWCVVLGRLVKHAARLTRAAMTGSCEQQMALNYILDACGGIRHAVMSRGTV